MSELPTVRAEIKEWERSFKEINSRAPTVDDIKANAAIASKYKLYKRLSKASTLESSSQPSKIAVEPSTPPRLTRPKAPTSILRSKSQIVQPTAPLATFNPFSPQKKQKGKERDFNLNNASDETRSRLFIEATRSQRQSLSPVPALQLRFPILSAAPSFPLHATPQTAVSRARKRLRGEPVSPSPNKDKRRRVSSQTALSFPRLNLNAEDSEAEDSKIEADSSFVDNSPVKPPITGKSFPTLFEQDVLPLDLFGIKANLGVTNAEPQKPAHKNKKTGNNASRKNATIVGAASQGMVNGSTALAQKRRSNSPSSVINTPGEASGKHSSAKRALSDEDMDEADQRPAARSKSPLIPPSPPPAGNTTFNRAGKNKYQSKKDTKSRKKVKVGSGRMDDDDQSDEVEVKGKLRIVGRNTLRSRNAAHQLDEDGAMFEADPMLGYPRFATPHAASPSTAQQEDGVVEIDLPEQLRSVLALDTATSQVSEENRLIKGLLYGRRIAHYDANKGGEIWDVGEEDNVDEHERQAEGEDDWEGEPVPWEVGEL